MDAALLEIAVKNRIPLYGFCRGMQSILSYFGNELVNVDGHVATRHFIETKAEKYEVNSYHNQASLELRKQSGLVIVAKSEDGIIEEIRHETLPIVGTMWHPERECDYVTRDLERINKLFTRNLSVYFNVNNKVVKVRDKDKRAPKPHARNNQTQGNKA